MHRQIFLPRQTQRRPNHLNNLLGLLLVVGCIFSECQTLTLERRSTRTSSELFSTKASLLSDESSSRSKRKLSRPERKALERERKQNSQRKNNFAVSSPTSRVASNLTESSTAADVMIAIKRAQNMQNMLHLQKIEEFLVEQTDLTFAPGHRGSLLSRLAVAALHMNNHRIARTAMDERLEYHHDSILPPESAALIRGLLRVNNVTEAMDVLTDELPLPATLEWEDTNELVRERHQSLLIHRASALCSITLKHFFDAKPSQAVEACQYLALVGPMAREAGLTTAQLDLSWDRLLSVAAECESMRRAQKDPLDTKGGLRLPCNLVYSVLDALTTFPAFNSDQVYEKVSNALVRRVIFVTGAVSMSGCPPDDRGEAVFIGRSNVGKSSLVNMLCNRKALAYTSKRPGKTQQFNYFAVNDKIGREKEIKYGDVVEGYKDLDSFYIVDVPGFGFAKVPSAQRRQWSDMLREYISHRATLRVVFHLIDGRHGPTEEDANIMKEMGNLLPARTSYVVVLTKADKNVKNASSEKNSGKITRPIMEQVREVMISNGVGRSPVIVTSAETKLGRDDIWRYLRLAAEA